VNKAEETQAPKKNTVPASKKKGIGKATRKADLKQFDDSSHSEEEEEYDDEEYDEEEESSEEERIDEKP